MKINWLKQYLLNGLRNGLYRDGILFLQLMFRNITTHSLGLMKNVMQRLYVMKKLPLPFRLPFKMTYGNPHKPFNHTVLQYYITLLLYLYIEIINK
ncbi:hypothetical protein [Streptococcus phage pST]|nr:hypothetical protein [Streptococcus phage pST]